MLSVADNGPGILESRREDVLRRYVRLDFSRSTPGNGLGLSLVKAIALLHGARLALRDNAPGLALSLTFRLSARAEKTPARDDAARSEPAGDRTGIPQKA